MPILIFILIFAIIIWLSAYLFEKIFESRGMSYEKSGNMYGFKTKLRGKEFKKAEAKIDEWLMNFGKSLNELINKHSLKIMDDVMNSRYYRYSGKEFKKYRKALNDWNDMFEKFVSMKHPNIDDSIGEGTFWDYHWYLGRTRLMLEINNHGIDIKNVALVH